MYRTLRRHPNLRDDLVAKLPRQMSAPPAAANPTPAQDRLAIPSPASRPPPINETNCSFSPTFRL